MKRLLLIAIVPFLLVGCVATSSIQASQEPTQSPELEATAVMLDMDGNVVSEAQPTNQGTDAEPPDDTPLPVGSWAQSSDLSAFDNVMLFISTFDLYSNFSSHDEVLEFAENANENQPGFKELYFKDTTLFVFYEFDEPGVSADELEKLAESTATLSKQFHDLLLTCGKGDVMVSYCLVNSAISSDPVIATLNEHLVYTSW